ncbi:hypothetical protein FH972_020964 [Carpinus fangiana]|uniref:Uncharacterized protein n=1 Tax=Carpinus fangiana TaxID=176857 RepID=A0A5N6KNC2_9ROSI|nr:hypothetical protein FH972_020964 [Carpinus fangiana]
MELAPHHVHRLTPAIDASRDLGMAGILLFLYHCPLELRDASRARYTQAKEEACLMLFKMLVRKDVLFSIVLHVDAATKPRHALRGMTRYHWWEQ